MIEFFFLQSSTHVLTYAFRSRRENLQSCIITCLSISLQFSKFLLLLHFVAVFKSFCSINHSFISRSPTSILFTVFVTVLNVKTDNKKQESASLMRCFTSARQRGQCFAC